MKGDSHKKENMAQPFLKINDKILKGGVLDGLNGFGLQ
jgi:hypothetical protein